MEGVCYEQILLSRFSYEALTGVLFEPGDQLGVLRDLPERSFRTYLEKNSPQALDSRR